MITFGYNKYPDLQIVVGAKRRVDYAAFAQILWIVERVYGHQRLVARFSYPQRSSPIGDHPVKTLHRFMTLFWVPKRKRYVTSRQTPAGQYWS
jgi:hypothetical protein